MPRNVTGQVLLVFLSLFLFDDVISRSCDDAKKGQERSGLSSEEPLRPVKDRFWRGPTHLGQISGISVDPWGYPVIFHRADRLWGFFTFNKNNVYTEGVRGPITEDTVITLNPRDGEIVRGWGNNTFYLPHGIHIDIYGDVWLTDIALHQVFKYDRSGVLKLTLGERFVPGNDLKHFCQPTSVAMGSIHEIFIADGYCNSRIVVFTPSGHPIYSIDKSQMVLNVPHSLTVLSNGDLCVADRENGRVVCVIGLVGSDSYITAGRIYSIPVPGRVFAVTSYNDTIYTVDKMTCEFCSMGYTINPYIQQVVDLWSSGFDFHNPHDIGISLNRKSLYVSEIGPNRVWKYELWKKTDL